MKEILSIISALNLMLMPVTPAAEASQTQTDISVESTYEIAVTTQNYLQGIFFELPDISPEINYPDPEPENPLQDLKEMAIQAAQPAISEPAPQPVPDVQVQPSMTLLGTYRLTAYCPCQKCCGKSKSNPNYGITASGVKAEEGITVAMAGLPFGTHIFIEGLGERIVQDRGVKGNLIDVFVASHERCFNSLYNRTAKVWIIDQ